MHNPNNPSDWPAEESFDEALRSALASLAPADALESAVPPPRLLRAYLDGPFDLEAALAARYPNLPLMSIVRVHDQMSAFLSTQDGAASIAVEAGEDGTAVDWTFMLGSMLALRFSVVGLSALDREHWLDKMRLGGGRPAFLWSASRWRDDYLIGVVQRYYTGLYAFSSRGTAAGARLTPETSQRLLAWLQQAWAAPSPAEGDADAADLTW